MKMIRRSSIFAAVFIQVCIVILVAGLLPMGQALAQNYEEVEKVLGHIVGKGDLTLEQALVMMNALKDMEEGEDEDQSIEEQLEEVGRELKEAVISGEMTEKEAWEEWYEFKEEEIAPQLKEAVEEGDMTEREARTLWHEIEKAEHGERLRVAVERGEMSERDARDKWNEINNDGKQDLGVTWKKLQGMVKDGKLTRKQAEEKMRAIKKKKASKGKRDGGVKDHFSRMGINAQRFERMKKVLIEKGVKAPKMEGVLWSILKVAHEIKSEGKDFELSPEIRKKLKEELSLQNEQIEVVKGMARRIVRAMNDSKRER